MAIAVMMVIILLNIALLLLVMRIGTQGEHHSELAAEQSAAVMALRSRLEIAGAKTVAQNKPAEAETTAEEADSE